MNWNVKLSLGTTHEDTFSQFSDLQWKAGRQILSDVRKSVCVEVAVELAVTAAASVLLCEVVVKSMSVT